MAFQKGHSYHPPKAQRKKTVWIMESLAQNGYNYEKMLVQFLERAAKGDKLAYDMAALLIKLVPHLAHAPKSDAGTTQIDTLVINRYAAPPLPGGSPSIDTTATPAEPQA